MSPAPAESSWFHRDLRQIRGLRLVVIIVATWLIGSALFAPWMNPLLGPGLARDAETASIMGMNWNEMARVRSEAVDYLDRHGSWPSRAADLSRPDDNGALRIEMPAAQEVRFTMGSGLAPESGLRGARVLLRFDPLQRQWSCSNDQPALPEKWLPSDCRPAGSFSTVQVLSGLLLLAVLALLLIFGLLAFADPRLAQLRQQPRRLRRQPIADLPRLDRQLGWLRRREASLAAAAVASEDWREALDYARADADARARLLALRISARCAHSPGWSLPGRVYEWQLPSTLPIALDRLLLYLPAPGLGARDLLRHLRAVETGQDVLLVVSPDSRSDAGLLAYAADDANLCAALDQATQSEWLLHPVPQEVLVALLARQLKITRISPYQTRGGVTRPAAFFGREQLLARVLNREPGNYLLVGGRQLGKTSLMKAIERRFVDHPRVRCHYLSLRDHRLGARLAAELELPAATPIESLVAALAVRAGQRRLLLLIDETDLFLREEARSGYAQLSALRSISEEGLCHFMLAGFWDLYQAVALDYASPIRNFGEVITLGALEHEACVALATQPLQRLGVHYADPALVDRLVHACGQRANLVAIVCQYGLEQLQRGERVIGEVQLLAALRSEPLFDALAGWARLSPDPQACALDRIIVYRTAQVCAAPSEGQCAPATIGIGTVLQELNDAGIKVDAEGLRSAFARLQLAYVLQREGDGYRFAVPLFGEQFQAAEVDALLGQEITALRVS